MDTANVGKGMFAAAFIIALFSLTLFFGGVEEQKRNPNQNPVSMSASGLVEVNLRRNRQGHYVVTGTINNEPSEFLLDTGATDVVIPAALAQRLGLKPGRATKAMTANGPITVYETIIDRLTIGDIQLFDVRASINPSMPPPAILLGMSALGQVEFVQSGNSLTLRQSTY